MSDYKLVPVEPTPAMREHWKRMRGYCWYDKYKAMLAAAPAVQPTPDVAGLVEALEEGLRAIGDHHAPGDCYATGPMTGDPFRDLVQCPACSFIAMCDDLLAAHHKGGDE